VATLVFLALSLAPGDAASLYLRPGMTVETLEQIRRNLGLDDPLLLRYARWLLAFGRGDFGYSFSHGMPVRDLLGSVLPNTLLLASVALGLSFALGILQGVVQAVKRGTPVDSVMSGVSLVLFSVPAFWLALMLILVFSVNARILWDLPFSLPSSGMMSADHERLGVLGQLGDRLAHLVLPTTTLTLVMTAGIARYVRVGMLDALGQEYVRTARAKGVPESGVVVRHALRNALVPLATLFGMYLPLLLSGTVLVEFVFSWPGMGRLMVESVGQRDYPVVLAATVLFGAMVVVGNLMADILYGIIDPRVRRGLA
jgi:peptide/nickel transport system permease protein